MDHLPRESVVEVFGMGGYRGGVGQVRAKQDKSTKDTLGWAGGKVK